MTTAEPEPQGCLSVLLKLFGISLPPSENPTPRADSRLRSPRLSPEVVVSPLAEESPEVGGDIDSTGEVALQDDSAANAPADAPLPFRLTDNFLSPAELSFYRVLCRAVQDRAVILCKVNLADIFYVSRPQSNQAYRNKIDRKHVDFLLCDPQAMRPLVGLELDDKSHQQPKRVERDMLVDSVFQAANLPLVRIAARLGYNPASLDAELSPYLSTDAKLAATPVGPANVAQAPVCPKCSIPMVKRVATKGPNQGNSFWGCQNYPRCRTTL